MTGMTDQLGRVLGGRYRLTAPVGTGSSAQVFLAEDVTLRRRVAVKVLHRALAADEAFLRRFRAEARAAAALSHPNLMAVYDWGEDEGPYLVLEFLGGGSLRGMLDSGARLSPSQAVVVGLDTARALDAAHSRSFVHRDIKPANLLFGDEGRLRIADFGLARALSEAAWTEPGDGLVGTARYAAPEQASSPRIDGKADVYALGLVLIESVTGQVPLTADTALGTLMRRIEVPVPVPDAMGPLRAVLERAGQPDPAERPTASELGRELFAAARTLDRPLPLPLAGALVGAAPQVDPTLLPPSASTPGPTTFAARGGASPDHVVPEPADIDLVGAEVRADLAGRPEVDGGLAAVRAGEAAAAATAAGPSADGHAVPEAADPSADTHADAVPAAADPSADAASVAAAGPSADAHVTSSPADPSADAHPAAAAVNAVGAAAALGGAGVDGSVATNGAFPTHRAVWADDVDRADADADADQVTVAARWADDPDDPDDRPVGAVSAKRAVGDRSVPFDELAPDVAARSSITDGPAPPLVATARQGSDRRRRRRWLMPLVLLVLLAVGAAGWFGYQAYEDAQPTSAAVPSLETLELAAAEEAVAAAEQGVEDGLDWALVVEEEHNEIVRAGFVIDQRPESGTVLEDGETVSMVVSLGPPPRAVPDLFNRTEEEARSDIATAELAVGSLEELNVEDVEAGRVITWSVAGADRPAEVPKGSEVDLVLSAGPAPRTVPPLAGVPVDAATAQLEELGLVVEVVEDFSSSVDAGIVIEPSPAEGTTLARGETVELRVSKGRDLVVVPEVFGFTIDEAIDVLRDFGLVAGDVSGPAGGTVNATDYDPGTSVDRGTVVDLFLGR